MNKQDFDHEIARMGAESFNVLRAFVAQGYTPIVEGVECCILCGYSKTTGIHHDFCAVGKAESVLARKDALMEANRPALPLLCDQDGCIAEATHSYVWADGKHLNACTPHIDKLRAVAAALGMGGVMSSIKRLTPPKPSDIHWVGLDEIE